VRLSRWMGKNVLKSALVIVSAVEGVLIECGVVA
jgi:hypothetical protein